MSNHLKRVLTALAAIPVIIGVTLAGNVWFLVFVLVLGTLGLHEFYTLSKGKGAKPLTMFGLAAGIWIIFSMYGEKGIAIPFILFGEAPNTESQFLFLVLLFTIPVLYAVELFRNNGSALLNLSTTILGLLYVSFFFAMLVGIRQMFIPSHVPVWKYFPAGSDQTEVLYHWGGYTVIALYAMIWMCDSAAYYVGSAIGKHKLFPRVSPNKSWEGAIGGFIAAILTAVGAKYLLLEYLQLHQAILLGGVVGVFGQLGDLFESLLKRDAGVKDSSQLIPGHGGILDRFDSLLFVSPIVYFYLDYIVFSFS